jgi:hypothetical protein
MASSPNIWLADSEAEVEHHYGTSDFFVAHIDGIETITLRQFYEAIADVLEFPLATFNLDALNDSLNDLQWLEDEKIVLYITNTESFISKERDPAKLSSVLQILDATAEDWKWIDSDDLMDRKEFYVVLTNGERIRNLLDKEQISYGYLASRNN